MSGDDKNDLAETRTDWAEDRTLLANERTFSNRMGFALGALGVALGLQGVFSAVDPTWIAKTAATVFIALAIYVAVFTYLKAVEMNQRLDSHDANPTRTREMRIVTGLTCTGAIGIAIVLWIS